MSDKRFQKIINAIQAEPWLIQPEKLDLIAAIVEEAGANPGAWEARTEGHKNRRRPMQMTDDGLAVIDVVGPLVRYGNMFSDVSGMTSTERLRDEFSLAARDPEVKGILLNIDSPGGQASGIAEFADLIYRTRQRKPVMAYVTGLGASAAYWIASAANQIIADPTAYLGSIGTAVSWMDATDFYARQGIHEKTMVSAQSPNKRADVRTEKGQAQLQRRLDELAQQFINTVARNRGVDASAVQEKFGQGDVLIAEDAFKVGMADALGYFDAAMRRTRERCGLSVGEEASVVLEPPAPPLQSISVEAERPSAPAAMLANPTEGEKEMADANKEAVVSAEASALAEMQAKLAAQEAEFAALKAEKERAEKLAAESSDRIAKLEADAQRKRFADRVREGKWFGNADEHVAHLCKLAGAFGEESAEVKFYCTQQDTHAAQVVEAGLFSERGKDSASLNDNPEQRAIKLAEAKMKDNQNLNLTSALELVFRENPTLYQEYAASTQVRV